MKVLLSWLLELCDLDKQPTVEEVSRALTRGGLEVEGMTDLGAGFSGVVVAQVVGKQPHPQSDKLTLVDVITERNGTPTQVVCGAPNVPEPGRKVLWAQIGAVLPVGEGKTITLASKPVKGVESPGMLCAEDELGLGDDHAGIIVLDEDDTTALGAPAQEALGLADWMLELNAPANRGDVLGHLGVARELVAVLHGKVVLPSTDLADFIESSGGEGAPFDVAIADAAQSARYTARLLTNVTVGKPASSVARKIAQRLRGVGVRSISNVVDVTNYVMFELGQPLHAFDADKLQGALRATRSPAAGRGEGELQGALRATRSPAAGRGEGELQGALRATRSPAAGRGEGELTGQRIAVTHARDGEPFITLDGVARTLIPGDIVIRDGDTAIALGGVMGGRDSEVTSATTRVLLESASFHALTIRRTARRLGLHSEASHRYERNVDPELAALGSARGARLLAQIAGAKIASDLVDTYPGKRAVPSIPVRLARVRMVSGMPLEAATCTDALERLGCAVTMTGDVFAVTPPSARLDITREVDVIEEILRIVGYDHVPSSLPVMRQAPGVRELDRGDAVRDALSAAGLYEAITYGFHSVERCAALNLSPTERRAQPIALKNPMSVDQAVMRTSLVPNLLAAIARNQSFGRPDVALFEVGSVFWRRGEGLTERPMHELADEPLFCAGVLAGKRPGQLGDGTAWDVFDAKAFAERAIRGVAGDIELRTRAVKTVSFLHPGVGGELLLALPSGDIVVGVFGEVHPETRRKLGVEGPAFVFDIDLGRIPLARPRQMARITKFPSSSRDVSLLLAAEIPAGKISDTIRAVREALVTQVRLLEDYRDAKLGDGMKSMLWSIEYRSPERTLTVEEVDKAHEAIVARLVDALPAQRR